MTGPMPFIADPDALSPATSRSGASPTLWCAVPRSPSFGLTGGVEYVEGAQFRGHEELDARIAHAYTEFVGSGKYAVAHADDVAGHDDIIMFTLQLIVHQ